MIKVNKIGKIVSIDIIGMNRIKSGVVVEKLKFKPISEIKMLAGYFSETKGKERHCYININTDGELFFTNIDENNRDINAHLIFIKS